MLISSFFECKSLFWIKDTNGTVFVMYDEIRKEILRNTPGYQAGSDTTAEDLMSETILKNIRTDVKITTY